VNQGCVEDQSKRSPSLPSDFGPGLSAEIRPVTGSMRKKRLVERDMRTSSPAGVSIHCGQGIWAVEAIAGVRNEVPVHEIARVEVGNPGMLCMVLPIR
jgi:hypothetical protein